MTPIDIVKDILPVLTIIANVLFLGVLILWIYSIVTKKEVRLLSFIKEQTILFSAIIAIVATCGSLFYSEIAGYTPCKMCWLERIFMYPQVILLVMAHLLADKKIFIYLLPLSILGILLSFYHYLLQLGVLTTTVCSTVGFSLSCSDTFFLQYGYITIPFMAVSAFALLALFSLITLVETKKK